MTYCGLCHLPADASRFDGRIWYDGVGMPICWECIVSAVTDAHLVSLSFEDLIQRLIGRAE